MFIVITIMTIFLILGVFLNGVFYSFEGEYVQSIIVLLFSIAIAIIAAYIFINEREKLRAGFPLEDERSKQIKQKASAYSFKASIYYLFVLFWYNIIALNIKSLPRMDTEAALGVSLGGIIIIFFIIWYILSKRGD